MDKIFGWVLLVILSIPVTLLGGVVLSDMWGWFIVPTFGAVVLTTWQAVGVLLVFTIFKLGLQHAKIEGEDDQPMISAFAKQVGYTVAYLVLWGMAAIWNLFI